LLRIAHGRVTYRWKQRVSMEPDTIERGLDKVLDALEAYTKSIGGKGRAAIELGISRVYLWRMLQGERPVSEAVLEKIGFERVTTTTVEYRKKT
jgi:hypothetical protein